jgi:magnesium-transporting ATPase (P-type)
MMVVMQVDMTTENYLASENLIFYGTSIVDGEGTGIVVRTGNAPTQSHAPRRVGWLSFMGWWWWGAFMRERR